MSNTKKKLSAWLPSTPCTVEMREHLIKVAEKEGRSLADLQRSAISLFLSSYDGYSIENDEKSIDLVKMDEG